MVYPKDFSFAQDKSILMLGNHISWWDGFWPLELNRRFFRKRYHVMMLEKELQKRMFLAQGGAFSINPGTRDIINSIRHAADLLNDSGNMVMIYPQGKIHSQHDRDIQFNPGIHKIIKLAPDNIQVIFSAALVDYGEKARPTLTYYLEEYAAQSPDGVQAAYNLFYDRALATQRERWKR